jgi:histidinol-phosphate aminotransferase
MAAGAAQEFNLQNIIRQNIKELTPYRCARDDYSDGLLLDANENSHSTSKYSRYPDPLSQELSKRIAQLHDVQQDQVILGVGSDEILDLIVRIFCDPGKDSILITPPTYGMYSVVAKVNDVQVVKVDLDQEFQLNVSQILCQDLSRVKVIFLTSPGNPTGTLLKKEDIKQILYAFRGVVVVDEAYIDFCEQDHSTVSMVKEYKNLIVTKTFSKAYGLAGIRIGMGFADEEIIQVFRKVKAPYNISSPTEELAKAALTEKGLKEVHENILKIKKERARLEQEFQKMQGFGRILGGNHANFILLEVLKDGQVSNEAALDLYKGLANEMGVIVRFRGHEVGCFGCLRITVGTEEENSILLEKMRILLKRN